MVAIWWGWGEQKRILSSAYYRITMSFSTKLKHELSRSPLSTPRETILLNTSATRSKRRGESGSPCLSPLLEAMSLPAIPLVPTEDLEKEKILEMMRIQFGLKPLCLRTEIIRSQLTESKAFAKPSLMVQRGSDTYSWKEMTSWAAAAQSWRERFLIKAD